MIFLDDLIAQMPDPLKERLKETAKLKSFMADGLTMEQALLCERRAGELETSLGVWAKEILRLAVLCFGSKPFGIDQLECFAEREGMPGAAVSVGLSGLMRHGIVFAFKKSWGEKLYVIPADIGSQCFTRLMRGAVEWKPVTGSVKTVRTTERNAAAVLFDLLLFVAKQKPSLTKKGILSKRHADAVRELLGVEPEAFDKLGLRYPNPDVYGAETAVFLDFAFRLGLICVKNQFLCTVPDVLREWLGQSEQSMNRTLLRLWLTLVTPESALSCHWLFVWMEMKQNDWYRLPVEAAGLFDLTVRPLSVLGWMDVGETTGSEPAVRMRISLNSTDSEQSAATGKFYAQPDFEVLAPPDVSYAARWELEVFTERIRTDRVTGYRITKESVRQALNAGRSIDGMLRFLDAHAKYGVPENVRGAMEQWAREHSKLRVETVTLLRCRDEEVAAEIAANPKLAACLGDNLGPHDFPVLSERVENFILLLNEAGYSSASAPPGNEISGCFPLSEQGAKGIKGHYEWKSNHDGFVYSDSPERLYEFSGDLHGDDSLSSKLREIPAIWMKDLRPYHGSTRRQIIETAIACKAMLRLRQSGEDRLLTPKRIQETGAGWSLQAYEKSGAVTLEQEQWEEMQLIVPGVHDLYY